MAVKIAAVLEFALHFYLVFGLFLKATQMGDTKTDKAKDPLYSKAGFVFIYAVVFGMQAVGLLPILKDFEPEPLQFWGGAVLFTTGFGLRVWSIRTLGRFFTFEIGVREGHRVVKDGPYSVVRHPSYTGYLMMMLGLGVSYQNALAFWGPMILTLIFLVVRISQEEKMLLENLGEEYRVYSKNTKRLIPFLF